MKQTTWICDKCGKEIVDVVYSLTCYARVLPGANVEKLISDAAEQNMLQSEHHREAHLCRDCKDAITDGVFIV